MSGAARRTQLASHVQEVSDFLSNFSTLTGDKRSAGRNMAAIEKYLEGLKKELDRLDTALGTGGASLRTNIVTARPSRRNRW